MNDPLFVIGVLFGAAGAILFALRYLYPESARRERRQVREFTRRAGDAGLRGRYKFEPDRPGSATSRRSGSYEAADGEDRTLFALVGAKIEGEAVFFAHEMLWTDNRLAWVGVPLLFFGVLTCAVSALV